MLDMELATQARAVVERRRADELNAEIATEQFAIEHRRQMAASAAQMLEAQTSAKRRRIAVHAAAIVSARIARDQRDAASEHRQQLEGELHYLKANLQQAAKVANAHRIIDPLATPDERKKIEHDRAELGVEVQRWRGLVTAKQPEYDRAIEAERQADFAFDKGAAEELRLRSEI